MTSLKECSINIGGYPYKFFRRVEKSDIQKIPRYYSSIPFLVSSTSEEQPEVFFNQSYEMIKRLKNEYSQEILATGEICWNQSNMTIDHLEISSRTNSTPLERKTWIEAVLGRINSMVLNERIWISDNEKEFYVYHPIRDFNRPKPKIFQVFPNI